MSHHAPLTLRIERQLGDWMRARLPHVVAEFVMFVLRQGWACLFGICLLSAILLTRAIWQADWPIHRYDTLFVVAVLLYLRTRIWFRIGENWY